MGEGRGEGEGAHPSDRLFESCGRPFGMAQARPFGYTQGTVAVNSLRSLALSARLRDATINWLAILIRTPASFLTVGVAEWLRRQVVALEIEGSNPSVHPTLP